MSTVQPPFPNFADLGGDPLDQGYIYIGIANQDPQTSPKQAYWDAALTIPATQPIRTLGGYIVRSGTPANVWVDGTYSVTVRNRGGALVATKPSTDNAYVTTADLALSTGAAGIGVIGSSTGEVATNLATAFNRQIKGLRKNFGLSGDPAEDATTKITQAFAAAAADDLIIEVEEGTYSSTTAQIFNAQRGSIIGWGGDRSFFKFSNSGIGLQIGRPVADSAYDLYNAKFSGFGILPNANTTVALKLMRCIYSDFSDIQIKPPDTVGSSFIGVHVGGAMYLNHFDRVIVDTLTQTAAANGKGWLIGAGQNDVGHAGAATNNNNFDLCRGIRFPIGFHILTAEGCDMSGCNAESNSQFGYLIEGALRTTLSTPWTEEAASDRSIKISRGNVQDGSGGFSGNRNSETTTILPAYPFDLIVDYANDTLLLNTKINRLTITANANGTRSKGMNLAILVGNLGADCDLQYILGGIQYHITQYGTNNAITTKTTAGGAKIFFETEGDANERYIESHRFGNLSISAGGGQIAFNGANPVTQYSAVTSAPDVAAIDTGRVFWRKNGGGKMEYCVRAPTGAAAVLWTEL